MLVLENLFCVQMNIKKKTLKYYYTHDIYN